MCPPPAGSAATDLGFSDGELERLAEGLGSGFDIEAEIQEAQRAAAAEQIDHYEPDVPDQSTYENEDGQFDYGAVE